MKETIYELEYKALKATVDTAEGMNVIGISFNGRNIITCDEKRKENGATYAIPVLFPTPNRVKGNSYVFEGRKVEGMMHGFLRHKSFHVDSASSSGIKASMLTDGTEPTFPYKAEIRIEIKLKESSIIWNFDIKNCDNCNFAYSLALHPFFSKEKMESIHANVRKRMLNDDDKIPTGETVDADPIDMKASLVDMDTVFIVDTPLSAGIRYDDFSIDISASKGFRHVVIYSSPDRDFLCIEPQTGSTDAHNLHSRGYDEEAGLIIVKPGEISSNNFRMDFKGRK